MKKKNIVLTALVFHIGIVIVTIHKNNKIVEFSQEKQRLEREYDTLTKKRETILHRLQTLKSPDEITRYAQTKLGLEKIRLAKIRKLNLNES